MASGSPPPVKRDRLLPWIAAERAFRAIVLITVGVVLVSHPHADWAAEITRFAEKLGLDPNSNWIRKLLERVRKIGSDKDVLFGVVALAYGALEGVEAYGLWMQRRWGEWLTVLATSLLLVPEIWELTKSATVIKAGVLIINLLVVAYLLRRLRGSAREPATAA